jgi:DNA-directed RNA polymerase subunit alpha
MTVRYGKFEIPEKVEGEGDAGRPDFGRFVAEPFERGYGHTVGTLLRRILLTSLEAPAIISFHLEGISHEYMSVEGIIEDVTTIILNLKGALLRRAPGEEEVRREVRVFTSTIDISPSDLKDGQKVITLGDLMPSSEFEVVNPELELFTVTKPMKKRVDLRVGIGRGYVPSERVSVPGKVVDEIVMDALYSPVRLVNYRVENTRVGQDTDYDRLVLEVTTDGRITPQEALAYAAQIAKAHLVSFEQVGEHELVFDSGESIGDSEREELLAKLALGIGEIELSVRSTNCLNAAGISHLGQLVMREEREMLEYRNFGRKSLTEIREKLEELGLGFGMDLSRYGLNTDNVMEIVETFIANRPEREVEA